MTGEKLRRSLTAIDESLANVARKLEMTPQNLDGILRTKDIKSGFIEKLALAYKKPISFFFEEKYDLHVREAGRDYVEKGKIEHKGPEYNGSGSTEADLREQIAILKSQLADKERIISLMEKQQSNS